MATQPTPDLYLRLVAETESNLKTEILSQWFPRALDPSGGFHQNYSHDWKLLPGDSKGIVYQSRLTWTSAQVALRYSDQRDFYLSQTRHGLAFLASQLWDQQNGGFFWAVDDSGKPTVNGILKQGYGNAFGIYAASANYKATGDPLALDLAQRAFRWYDSRAHDAQNGGYLEIAPEPGRQTDVPSTVGAQPGQKSMNTSIHLLEAFTSLHEIWPDPLLRDRLHEMFLIIRDRVYADPGYLVQFLLADWTPIESEDSYGHDVETAYLLAEAAAALHIPDDPQTWKNGRKLIDHSLKVAVDPTHGGLYNEGAVEGGHYEQAKSWWVQAEFLNVLLLMHEHFGRETLTYWNAFLSTWNFIKQHQIDKTHGGWHPQVTPDGIPTSRLNKSDAWTECYHQARAMMNVTDMLRKMAE